MYIPKLYQKHDPAFIHKVVRENPFAELFTAGKQLICSHIPVLIDDSFEKLVLFGHIAKLNDQYASLIQEEMALLVFRGPHSYISSSWYERKGKISTWDYSAIHLQVKCSLQSDRELLESLKRLYQFFEGDSKLFDQINKDHLETNLRHIGGFWFYPEKIDSIAKWHQDYPKEDVLSIIRHLAESNDPQKLNLANELEEEHHLNNETEE